MANEFSDEHGPSRNPSRQDKDKAALYIRPFNHTDPVHKAVWYLDDVWTDSPGTPWWMDVQWALWEAT